MHFVQKESEIKGILELKDKLFKQKDELIKQKN